MEHWLNDAKWVKAKYLEQSLPPCHCVHPSPICTSYCMLLMETT